MEHRPVSRRAASEMVTLHDTLKSLAAARTDDVDPLAVAALLKAIGPVSVPSWPVPISAENAASVLLHEQYVAL